MTNIPMVSSPMVARSWLRLASLVALTALVAFVDTVTPREIAAAGFYVVVVLLALRVFRRPGVLAVAAICAALTMASFLANESGSHDSGIINLAICLAGIGVTAYLGIRMEEVSADAQQTRAQLAHATRVASLGELTASIAHEVNQPLTAIATSGRAAARWLAQDTPNVARAVQALDRVEADAIRASNIIAHVRRLAEGAPPRTEPVDLNQVVLDVVALTRGEAYDAGIQVVTHLAEALPVVRLDRVQMQQVVVNLVTNAIEAIRTRRRGGRRIELRTEMTRGGTGVVLSVNDSGPGFETVHADRLFEPFYTTKKSGMGIGLSISRNIVEEYGGRITAASGPTGSTFTVVLPCTEAT